LTPAAVAVLVGGGADGGADGCCGTTEGMLCGDGIWYADGGP